MGIGFHLPKKGRRNRGVIAKIEAAFQSRPLTLAHLLV